MAGELQSIAGLLPKYLDRLEDPLGIRTPGDLVRADRRSVQAAMSRLRPRPTLEDVSGWQDAARDLATAVSEPDWEQAAAFVVSFESRTATAGADRRTVVEQAEHDPPMPRTEWPGWQCSALCEWLLDRPDLATPGVGPAAEPPQDPPAPAAVRRATRRDRPAVTVLRAEIISPDGSAAPLVTDDRSDVDVPSGARLRVSLAGPPPAETYVALRLRHPGAPSTTPHDIASVGTGGTVDIALAGFPVGSFDARLVAWHPGAEWAPSAVRLPRLRRAVPDT